jgi:hypothetical protein
MIDDGQLRTQTDYSAGQTEAAHRVLVELTQLFSLMAQDSEFHRLVFIGCDPTCSLNSVCVTFCTVPTDARQCGI